MASILDDDDDAYMISSNFSLVRYNNPIIIDKNEDLSKCPTPSGKPKGQKDTEEVRNNLFIKCSMQLMEQPSSHSLLSYFLQGSTVVYMRFL